MSGNFNSDSCVDVRMRGEDSEESGKGEIIEKQQQQEEEEEEERKKEKEKKGRRRKEEEEKYIGILIKIN